MSECVPRGLDELINRDEPGWNLVQEWMCSATIAVEVLPAQPTKADDCLVAMQVSTRSPMGAIIHNSGGLLVDDGWIRVLGSGSAKLPRAMHDWNLGRTFAIWGRKPAAVLIADDVAGGFFALDGGALGDSSGRVFYFAPDTLEWEDTELGYTGFLTWCFTGDLDDYYADYRWSGWRDNLKNLPGDQVYAFAPWPFTDGPPIIERSRARIPIAEAWDLFVGDSLQPPETP